LFEKAIATVSQVEGIGVDEWSQPTQRPSAGLSNLNSYAPPMHWALIDEITAVFDPLRWHGGRFSQA